MIIVPTLAKGDHGDEAVVSRVVACLKASRSPKVRGRIHEPGKMPANDGSKEDTGKDHRPSADREQDDGNDHGHQVVVLLDKDKIRVTKQVGRIFLNDR